MAWESWKESSPERKLLWAVCSVLWLALLLLFARSLDLTVPYLPLAIAGGLVFYLRNWPKVAELLAWVVVSAGFGFVARFPHDHDWVNTGSGVLALFGLGAFLMLGLRWLWSQASERRKTYAVLAPAAALVFFVLSAQRALNLANLLSPKVFDLYLYVFDGSFGFEPSFLAGKAMAGSSVLRIAAGLTYTSLPFVMALVYALRLPEGTERPSWDVITLFMLAGLGGWALYNVVPATGPKYVFLTDFPWRSLPYRSMHKLLLEQIPVNSDIPRNAIPSLHMAWVVLLCWNAKGLSRALRIFLAAYLVLTVVSTLGTGEHYFVDLVAGVPFALFVQVMVSPDRKTSLSRRAIAASLALALTLGWLLLVRFGARSMLVSPILPWSLVVLTGVGVWRIKSWFDASLNESLEASVVAQTKPLAFGAHN
jgi:PAP2 superfamily protein